MTANPFCGFCSGVLSKRKPICGSILQIYEEGRIPLYHFDVYRIADVEEMEEIGYEDCFYGEGVCLIEWPSLIREILPGQAVWVSIEKDMGRGFDYRKITVEETS